MLTSFQASILPEGGALRFRLYDNVIIMPGPRREPEPRHTEAVHNIAKATGAKMVELGIGYLSDPEKLRRHRRILSVAPLIGWRVVKKLIKGEL